jgi:hypothetical protein
MSKGQRLQELLENSRIYSAGGVSSGSGTVGPGKVIPTGFVELNQKLSGGWPAAALTEVFVDAYGSGELRLLLPTLARLSQCAATDSVEPSLAPSFAPSFARWVLWVSPPYTPYAPALAAGGVDVSRVLLVRCDTNADSLWAIEQALLSSSCAAVFAWVSQMNGHVMRRLQLAAESSNSLVVFFRPGRYMRERSTAWLRLHLESEPGQLRVNILRSRTGRPGVVVLDV